MPSESPSRAAEAALNDASPARAPLGPRLIAALTVSIEPASRADPSRPQAILELEPAPAATTVRSTPPAVSWVAPAGAIDFSQVAAATLSRTEATSRMAGEDASPASTDTPSWPLNQGLISVEKSCLLLVSRWTSLFSPSSALASKLVWSAKPGKCDRNASRLAR